MKKRVGIIACCIVIVAVAFVIITQMSKPKEPSPKAGSASTPGSSSAQVSSSQPAGSSQGAAASSSAAGEQNTAVILYVPDEQAEYLVPVGAQAKDRSGQSLVDALVTAGALPKGCIVNSCTQEGATVRVDMNAVYGDAVKASGTAGETMLIYSLADTLLREYAAESLYLTVDGKPLETGHNIYSDALEMDHTA